MDEFARMMSMEGVRRLKQPKKKTVVAQRADMLEAMLRYRSQP